MTSCWSKSKTGKKHPYYMCFTKGCASYRKSIRKKEIESAFRDLVRDVNPSRGVVRAAEAMFADIWNARVARCQEDAKRIAKQIAETDAEVETLVEKLIETDSKPVIAAIERKIGALEEQKLLLAEKVDGLRPV